LRLRRQWSATERSVLASEQIDADDIGLLVDDVIDEPGS